MGGWGGGRSREKEGAPLPTGLRTLPNSPSNSLENGSEKAGRVSRHQRRNPDMNTDETGPAVDNDDDMCGVQFHPSTRTSKKLMAVFTLDNDRNYHPLFSAPATARRRARRTRADAYNAKNLHYSDVKDSYGGIPRLVHVFNTTIHSTCRILVVSTFVLELEATGVGTCRLVAGASG
eukprot:COSAG02_NODE_22313_length_756_cov_1.452055_1_plen_177_part_00